MLSEASTGVQGQENNSTLGRTELRQVVKFPTRPMKFPLIVKGMAATEDWRRRAWWKVSVSFGSCCSGAALPVLLSTGFPKGFALPLPPISMDSASDPDGFGHGVFPECSPHPLFQGLGACYY